MMLYLLDAETKHEYTMLYHINNTINEHQQRVSSSSDEQFCDIIR